MEYQPAPFSISQMFIPSPHTQSGLKTPHSLAHPWEALGKQKEEYVMAAQSRTKNAHAASKAAAFTLFRTQLEEDTAAFEAIKIRLARAL